jgi:hypothetical protein
MLAHENKRSSALRFLAVVFFIECSLDNSVIDSLLSGISIKKLRNKNLTKAPTPTNARALRSGLILKGKRDFLN